MDVEATSLRFDRATAIGIFSKREESQQVYPGRPPRCPAVDPDDHHLYASLGCAAENLAQAALAHGLIPQPAFDAARDAIDIALESTRAMSTPLFNAITERQCTRGEYDGAPLTNAALAALQRAGSSDKVDLILLAEKPVLERVLEQVVQGNSAPLRAPFAASVGLAGRRPDLVVRFGRGPKLPPSLRRPVASVLA